MSLRLPIVLYVCLSVCLSIDLSIVSAVCLLARRETLSLGIYTFFSRKGTVRLL